MYLGLKRDVHG